LFFRYPFLFTGRRFDADTGLYYYRARYYNPYIGRFLQTDPIGYGAGMNLYRYCEHRPTVRVDPSGRIPPMEPPRMPPLVSPDAPWWWGPIVWDMGKPDYPSDQPWWTGDFFNWYRHGGGDDVWLDAIGLGETFRSDPQIAGPAAEFVEEVRNLAKCEAERGASGVQGVTMSGEMTALPIRYNFAPNRDGISLGRAAYTDPLSSLGGGSVTMWAEWCVGPSLRAPGEWVWSIHVVFTLRDRFTDPSDVRNENNEPREWRNCTPYDIRYEWEVYDSGFVTAMIPSDE
jgi:RHS repeat-associated protein